MKTRMNLNAGWSFMKLPGRTLQDVASVADLEWNGAEDVCVPHTWYDDEEQYQGLAVYRRTAQTEETGAKRYLEFEGVEQQCKVFVNGLYAGEHRGAYARFRIAVPQELDKERLLEVIVFVENKICDTLAPMFGDFTVFGGMYRDVNLLIVDDTHFDYTYYGTDGVIVRTSVETSEKGIMTLEPHVAAENEQILVLYAVYDENGREVAAATGEADETVKVCIDAPILWNGLGDAHLYRVVATLVADGEKRDETVITTGFCDTRVDPGKGFFLNGEHVRLRGVAVHQDFAGVYNAVSKEHIDKNFELIGEIGANAVRLSHYQHPQYTYDRCDELGYVVWAEIPMLKMTLNDELLESTAVQLHELILQNIHHPSIFCWGIQNEIAMFRDDPFMHERCEKLSAIVHKLDPGRCSAGANLFSVKAKSRMNEVSDIVGYNIYFGWYYGEMEDYREYLDKLHGTKPQVPYGISEYGVDASVTLHSDSPRVKDYSEEYQALFHETVYPIFEEKDFLWGSFVWNMFDFHSARRNEGGTRFLNAKGLVTHDRETRKDAFYYYKAKWSDVPTLHICSKRYVNRPAESIDVKLYTNLTSATLYCNDVPVGTEKNNGNATIIFPGVLLQEGVNRLTACGEGLEDSCEFVRTDAPDPGYALPDSGEGGMVKNWFLEDELVREGYYSVSNRADEILASKEAKTVLEEYFPDLVKVMTERDVIPLGLDLKSILGRELGGEDGEKLLLEINAKLNQIKDEEM